MRSLPLIALVLVLPRLPQRLLAADVLPRFDTQRNCRAEVAESSGIGETLESCVKDEQSAKNELAAQWPHFSRDHKLACVRETQIDTTPSYVELETCLEMLEGTSPGMR